MNKLNKKAVSAVVATVLIIMITVAAVGIIWAAIIPMVKDSLTEGTICNDAVSDITLVSDNGYTCMNSSALCYNTTDADLNPTQNVACTNISLQIEKGPNAKVELVAIQALVFVGGDSYSVRVEKNNTASVTNSISGTLPGNNVKRMINIWGTDFNNATAVEIAPIVTVGKTEKTCKAAQKVILGPCRN